MNKRIISAVAGVVFASLCSSTGHTQNRFYAGKTVRIIVRFSAGGTYDVWARLMAQRMSKYIPGSPNFVAQDMRGGGSMVAANYFYNVAKPDG
jgi:tripartite-type tricarboxylate transporter receptor subunit TctC